MTDYCGVLLWRKSCTKMQAKIPYIVQSDASSVDFFLTLRSHICLVKLLFMIMIKMYMHTPARTQSENIPDIEDQYAYVSRSNIS